MLLERIITNADQLTKFFKEYDFERRNFKNFEEDMDLLEKAMDDIIHRVKDIEIYIYSHYKKIYIEVRYPLYKWNGRQYDHVIQRKGSFVNYDYESFRDKKLKVLSMIRERIGDYRIRKLFSGFKPRINIDQFVKKAS